MNHHVLAEMMRWAERDAACEALLAPGRDAMTRGGLVARMGGVALALARMGVRRGDVVAVVAPGGVDLLATVLGVMSRAIAAPLNPAATRAEMEMYLGELRPRAVIVERRDTEAAAAARVMDVPVVELDALAIDEPAAALEAEPRDRALILFTSATTDRPKGVPLTHANLVAMAAAARASMGLGERDRFLSMMPLFHLQGLISCVAQLLAGGSVVETGGFDAARFNDWMKHFEPSWYSAGPALHGSILNVAELRTPGLRFVASIGARLEPARLKRIEERLGVPVLEGYGLTETGVITRTAMPPGERRAGSVGRRCGPEVAIFGVDGMPVAAGEEGEIGVRGESVMEAYLENEEATRRAFRDGWFMTGDAGRMDADGYLFITGRIKEMINRGGEKVLPVEVDDALMAHEAVREAAAFGRPHATLGEDVAAAVVLREGAAVTELELRWHAARLLAAHKVPRRVYFVEELPRGATGKVRRVELAAAFPASARPYVAPRRGAERRLCEMWQRLLKVERVGVDDDFFELGGDSLAMTLLAAELGVEFDEGRFFERPSVAVLAAMLDGAAPASRSRGPAVRTALVALQREGARTPFYCISGADENPYYFRELAQAVGEERPFYVLRDPRPMELRGDYTLAGLAAGLIPHLLKAQPSGPYIIGGHCFGGVVAYEMARQLVEGGKSVGLVVMFEAPAPGYPKVLKNWRGYARQAAEIVKGRRRVTVGEVREHLRLVARLTRRQSEALAREVSPAAADGQSHANKRAMRSYTIRPLKCDVVQFIAREEQRQSTVLDDPLTVWREFVRGRFEVVDAEGRAERMFRQPQVRVLAERLRAALERVEER